jgi:7-cyano-7-deazaguanine reductase
MSKKTYKDVDIKILKSIPNPSKEAYEIKIKIPECTFIGVGNQPDFATLYLTMYPGSHIIELKSLKFYIFQFRDITTSYERFINVVFDHLIEVYAPDRLRLVIIFNPRGGISSRLTIDSDWAIRGGTDKYKSWDSRDDEWEVTM